MGKDETNQKRQQWIENHLNDCEQRVDSIRAIEATLECCSDEELVDAFLSLKDLVYDRIEIIGSGTKWKLSSYEQNRLSEEEALNLNCYHKYPESLYYRFKGEAPNEDLLAIFRELVDQLDYSGTLESFLEHRSCQVFFEGGDLIIINGYTPFDKQTASTGGVLSSFVGIDFETLYSQRVSACAVGMVKYREGKIVDRYYTLIRPPFDYPGKKGNALTWIHGFTEDMLVNERTFDQVLPEMEAFAEGLPLVAHNASVERCCIRDASEYYGLTTTLDYDGIWDTLNLSRMIEQEIGIYEEGPGIHRLDAVCRRFNVPELHHHNALDDAEMCGNLMIRFYEIQKGIVPVPEATETPQITIAPQKDPMAKICKEDKVQRTDLENVADNPFKDKNVVLTGFSKAVSQDYAHRLNELGAIVRDQVSGKTKILITGPNAGPAKIAKCKDLGAQIMSEEEFLKVISL